MTIVSNLRLCGRALSALVLWAAFPLLISAQTFDIGQLIDDAVRRQSNILTELNKVQTERMSVQKVLEDNANGVSKLSDNEAGTMRDKLLLLRDQEKKITEKYKACYEEIAKLNEIKALPEARRAAMLEQMYGKKDASTPAGQPAGQGKEDPVSPVQPALPMRSDPKLRYAQDCTLAYKGTDEFSGKGRKDTKPEVLFSYTEDRLKDYLKEKEYIVCTSEFSALDGGYLFMALRFTIQTTEPQQSFGMLEKGSAVTIKFLDGETVKAFNSRTDLGTIDASKGQTTFVATYAINSNDIKKLKEDQLDKIRIVWGSGYEDYDVYDVDIFNRQLKCLYAD